MMTTTDRPRTQRHPAAELTDLAESHSAHASRELRASARAQAHLCAVLADMGLNSDELTDLAKLVGRVAEHEFNAGLHQARATDARVAAQDALDGGVGR